MGTVFDEQYQIFFVIYFFEKDQLYNVGGSKLWFKTIYQIPNGPRMPMIHFVNKIFK